MMNTKRFFAYGCSFTNYTWPTWADLIGRNYNEYYNYGRAGAGNFHIFHALMETDQHHKITKDDVVIIQWSCFSREDRYKNGKWLTNGNITNHYTTSEIKKFFDFRGFLIRDYAIIKATKSFLDNIGCEYYFLSMVPLVDNKMYASMFETETKDAEDLYKDVLNVIKPSYEEIIGTVKTRPKMFYGKILEDSHPLPTEHYDYIAAVLPNHLLPGPRSVAEELDEKLASFYTTSYGTWTYVFPDKQKGNDQKTPRL